MRRRAVSNASLPPDLAQLAIRIADAAPANREHRAKMALVPWELIEQVRARAIVEGKDESTPLVVDVCRNAGREGRFLGWFRNVKARMA